TRQPGVRGPTGEKCCRFHEGNVMRSGDANLVTGRCLLKVKKDIAVLLEDEGLISGAVALPSGVLDVRPGIPNGEIRKLLAEMAGVVLPYSRKGSVFRPIHRPASFNFSLLRVRGYRGGVVVRPRFPIPVDRSGNILPFPRQAEIAAIGHDVR